MLEVGGVEYEYEGIMERKKIDTADDEDLYSIHLAAMCYPSSKLFGKQENDPTLSSGQTWAVKLSFEAWATRAASPLQSFYSYCAKQPKTESLLNTDLRL